jgi:hypothetical protein
MCTITSSFSHVRTAKPWLNMAVISIMLGKTSQLGDNQVDKGIDDPFIREQIDFQA